MIKATFPLPAPKNTRVQAVVMTNRKLPLRIFFSLKAMLKRGGCKKSLSLSWSRNWPFGVFINHDPMKHMSVMVQECVGDEANHFIRLAVGQSGSKGFLSLSILSRDGGVGFRWIRRDYLVFSCCI